MKMVKNKSISYFMIAAALSSTINGILLYALSMELSSNMYYSTTQFATLYTTCIMFLGHGLGGVLFSKFTSLSDRSITFTLKIWILAICITFLGVFKIFPPVMQMIYTLCISSHNMIAHDGTWMKILFSGLIEMPVFLSEGMVYSSIFSFVRKEYSDKTPNVAALSTVGSAAGYLLGMVIPGFPGINATFLLILVGLCLLIWNKPYYINIAVILVVLVIMKWGNADSGIESLRSKYNSVYANAIGGTVIDYDWSRFQKSEFVSIDKNGSKKMYLILNGAMQVMASQNPEIIKNIGYEILYQPIFVQGKKVLIIGGGMGRGAELAIQNGAEYVDIVDIEPALLKKYETYKEYNNNIYENDKVHFHIMDGRYALKNFKKQKYDLVVFEGVINAAAVYSLNITTEGYLYTAEAVKDALEILDTNGIFLDFTISSERTMQSFIAQYPQLAKQYTMNYIYAYVNDKLANNNYYVSIAGISQDISALENLGLELQSSQNEYIEISDYVKRPITGSLKRPILDDRPFPYINSSDEVAFEIIFAIISIFIAIVICSVGMRKQVIAISYLQFVILGIAMMMMELYVINKLNFYLNDSMMSYSIGSAVFLSSFAIGNSLSVRLKINKLTFGILFCISVIAFAVFFNSPIKNVLLDTTLLFRILTVIILMTPLAFFCGTFFPRLLLRLVNEDKIASSMGYIMLLDAFGVVGGFFLYNYIGCLWGFNYTLPFIIILYLLEVIICYKKGSTI